MLEPIAGSRIRFKIPRPSKFSPISTRTKIKKTSAETWALYALAGATFLFLLATSFFSERRFGCEEITVHNMAYMLRHYGKICFPLYGYFLDASYDFSFFHPPTHYFEIACLLKLGFSLYYAAPVPVLLLSMACCWVLIKGPLDDLTKLGFLTGFFAFIAFWVSFYPVDYSLHLRPDMHMAVAWFLGLLLLECSRKKQWDLTYMGLGCFTVVYAAGIHYLGYASILAIPLYWFKSFSELRFQKFKKVFIAGLAGALISGLPYLVLFFMPTVEWIRYLGKGSAANGGLLWTIQQNFPIYKGGADQFYALTLNPWDFAYAAPLGLLLKHAIPVVPVYAMLLLLFPSTRLFTIATLPLTLSYFFLVRRKTFYYMGPEILMLFIGMAVASLQAMVYAIRKTSLNQKILFPGVAVMASVAIFMGSPALKNVEISLKPRVHELQVARAIGRSIVGENALVASQHPLWYVSGSQRWFDLTGDLFWKLPSMDLRDYYAQFDYVGAIALAFMGTNTGWNELSLYKEKIVDMTGFYVKKDKAYAPGWFWFSAKPKRPVIGYFWQKNELWRFDENISQESVFVSLESKAPNDESLMHLSEKIAALTHSFIYLPLKEKETTPRVMGFFLWERSVYEKNKQVLSADYEILREWRGGVKRVEIDALLGTLDSDTTPIEFIRTFGEAIAPNASAQADSPEISVSFSPEDHNVTFKTLDPKTDFKVRKKRTTMEWMARSGNVVLEKNAYYLVSFDWTLKSGGAALYMMESDSDSPVSFVKRNVPQAMERVNFVVFTGEHAEKRFVLTAYNQLRRKNTEVTMRNFRLKRVRLA